MRAEGAPENFWGYTKAETLKNLLFWEFWIWKKIKTPFRFLRIFVKNKNPPSLFLKSKIVKNKTPPPTPKIWEFFGP